MNKQSIEREDSGEGLLYEKFGTLAENLNSIPKVDQSGCGSNLPLKYYILKV